MAIIVIAQKLSLVRVRKLRVLHHNPLVFLMVGNAQLKLQVIAVVKLVVCLAKLSENALTFVTVVRVLNGFYGYRLLTKRPIYHLNFLRTDHIYDILLLIIILAYNFIE